MPIVFSSSHSGGNKTDNRHGNHKRCYIGPCHRYMEGLAWSQEPSHLCPRHLGRVYSWVPFYGVALAFACED